MQKIAKEENTHTPRRMALLNVWTLRHQNVLVSSTSISIGLSLITSSSVSKINPFFGDSLVFFAFYTPIKFRSNHEGTVP